MLKTISISHSPNAQKDDILLALKILFSPISWFNFRETEKLEREFASYFGKDYKALAVNSARSAEYLILKSQNIGQGDEVIVQGFTCVAVPNSVLWNSANPVYVDIDNTFNIEATDLKRKITKKTKAVIIQHSFGIPANITKIKNAVANKKILIIEDCALSLGAKYNGKKVGTLGDISFFSFGRDKVISGVFGGMILVKDRKLYERIKEIRDDLDYPSWRWVFQQLMHPLVLSLVLPLYNFGYKKVTLGKIILFLFQKFRFITKSIYEEEKYARKPSVFPKKLPGGLATLAFNQIKKLDEFNIHRKKISELYFRILKDKRVILPPKISGAIWMRFPILTKKATDIFNYAKSKGILLGDWYRSPIMPVKNYNLVKFNPNSCPTSAKYSQMIINLPTYPNLSKNDARFIVKTIKKCLHTK